MLFRDVIGHKDVKRHLIHEVSSGRISHAQMFVGSTGIEGLPLALAFTRYIMCANPGPEDSCGECGACLKMDKLSHPDVHFSFPIILKSKKVDVSDDVLAEWRETILNDPYSSCSEWTVSMGGENKQGIIGNKESYEIIRKLTLKPFEGGYKVMLIWMPELMNATASNKLLKILEEPPDKTIFIMVTENQEQLLPTVLSRTQLVQLGRISAEEIMQGLIDREGASADEARKAAAFASGSYSVAMEYLNHVVDGDSDFTSFSHWMRICYKRNVPEAIKWAESMAGNGREIQKKFLEYSLHMVRECMVLNYAGEDMTHLYGEEEQFADKFSPFINERNVVELTEELNKAHYDLSRNANSKILFLDLSFKVFKLLKQ